MRNEEVFIDNVAIVEQVEDWIHAIQLGVKPLIDHQCVDENYTNAIVKNVKKYGSNFIVSPHIVLPHARPEQGVIKNAVSILLLRKPCYLNGSTMPIKLMIIMAVVDSKSHLKTLQYVAGILNDDTTMSKIMNSKTSAELLEHFTAKKKEGM